MPDTKTPRTIKIASWNVNSLRVRLPQLTEWAALHQPDIIALQEIKLPEEQFPHDAMADLGYDSVFLGQKTYNGVAILTRSAPQEILQELPGLSDDPLQRRAIAVTCHGLRIINVYVPNGESLLSPKFTYKLTWLKALRNFLEAQMQHYEHVLVMGDFNIAPSDVDVYDPQAWQGHVLVSAAERDALAEILQMGFFDIYRALNIDTTEFTWWDYRAGAFYKNRGLRIDHFLGNQSVLKQCLRCFVDKDARAWTRPSDHAPILLELELSEDTGLC